MQELEVRPEAVFVGHGVKAVHLSVLSVARDLHAKPSGHREELDLLIREVRHGARLLQGACSQRSGSNLVRLLRCTAARKEQPHRTQGGVLRMRVVHAGIVREAQLHHPCVWVDTASAGKEGAHLIDIVAPEQNLQLLLRAECLRNLHRIQSLLGVLVGHVAKQLTQSVLRHGWKLHWLAADLIGHLLGHAHHDCRCGCHVLAAIVRNEAKHPLSCSLDLVQSQVPQDLRLKFGDALSWRHHVSKNV
mmetsp:Transcript_9265/g.25988  ORF Transcript_9265/g.25988 Transcript_9265/m.25988 type:complete len:247 (+) Transcript_9265:1383-2123(+)